MSNLTAWLRISHESDRCFFLQLQDLSLLEEVIRMMLEIFNSILCHSLSQNTHLVYNLLYQREYLAPIHTHPRFSVSPFLFLPILSPLRRSLLARAFSISPPRHQALEDCCIPSIRFDLIIWHFVSLIRIIVRLLSSLKGGMPLLMHFDRNFRSGFFNGCIACEFILISEVPQTLR